MRRPLTVSLFAALLSAVLLPAALSAVDLKGGPYARLRHEYWHNIFDMNSANPDDRNYFRFKFSLWGSADFGRGVSVFARLTNESKAYVAFDGGDSRYNISEAVFDGLYVDVRDLLGYPVDLRLGRQDFLGTYGEGFLIMDGTPLDGSRTYYFNAARAAWRINERNTLDALYIGDTRFDDQLPVINEVPGRQPLNYTDETAWGLYQKSDPRPGLHWENYYLWKKENGGGPKLTALETRLNTLGTFARWQIGASPWLVKGQLAYQFGDYGTNGRSGLGGYAFAEGSFKDRGGNLVAGAGYVYLSGDDPSTPQNEAWDPLFSRWPWMSELYVLSYNSESGMGYWTNLSMPRVYLTVSPADKVKVSLSYNILAANQKAPAGPLFAGGTDRGRLYQGRVDYAFTKNITAYFLADYFTPGDFYAGSDPAVFLRTELQFKY